MAQTTFVSVLEVVCICHGLGWVCFGIRSKLYFLLFFRNRVRNLNISEKIKNSRGENNVTTTYVQTTWLI